jgi:hypothetical protein
MIRLVALHDLMILADGVITLWGASSGLRAGYYALRSEFRPEGRLQRSEERVPAWGPGKAFTQR